MRFKRYFATHEIKFVKHSSNEPLVIVCSILFEKIINQCSKAVPGISFVSVEQL